MREHALHGAPHHTAICKDQAVLLLVLVYRYIYILIVYWHFTNIHDDPPPLTFVLRSRKPLPTIVPLVGTKSDAGGEIVLGKADAFEPSTYEDLLKGAKAVVIAVG